MLEVQSAACSEGCSVKFFLLLLSLLMSCLDMQIGRLQLSETTGTERNMKWKLNDAVWHV